MSGAGEDSATGVPAWEPFLPPLPGADLAVRDVGVAERGFESASLSIRRLLEAGFFVAAVPFFLMADVEGAGRFFEGARVGFTSIGEVMLSATLAFLFARRPRSLCFAISIALSVSTSIFSLVTDCRRSKDWPTFLAGVASRGVPEGSCLMKGRGEGNCDSLS